MRGGFLAASMLISDGMAKVRGRFAAQTYLNLIIIVVGGRIYCAWKLSTAERRVEDEGAITDFPSNEMKFILVELILKLRPEFFIRNQLGIGTLESSENSNI